VGTGIKLCYGKAAPVLTGRALSNVLNKNLYADSSCLGNNVNKVRFTDEEKVKVYDQLLNSDITPEMKRDLYSNYDVSEKTVRKWKHLKNKSTSSSSSSSSSSAAAADDKKRKASEVDTDDDDDVVHSHMNIKRRHIVIDDDDDEVL
jgi:transposase-like protein